MMMAEAYCGGVDMGVTSWRAGLWTPEGSLVGWEAGQTDIADYEGTITAVGDTLQRIADRADGQIVTVSMGVASAVEDGNLTQAEDMTPWVKDGRRPGDDLARAIPDLNSDKEAVRIWNDMVVIAFSQVEKNRTNRKRVSGTVATVSSGFNTATYDGEGNVAPDEAGHEPYTPEDQGRLVSICGCGNPGHCGAYISGEGFANNHEGMKLKDGLAIPEVRTLYVADLAAITIGFIERHIRDRGHQAEEIRWTGGVALNNRDIVFDEVHGRVNDHFAEQSPVFETVIMDDLAGMHGAGADARNHYHEAET